MSASNEVPIAVVGMGCRFPGGVETPGGLWQLAADGGTTVGPVPPDRWDAARLAALHDADLAAAARFGCFLDGDVWAWDPESLSVATIEQDAVDPQFRVLMEVAWEAVEHAGIPMDRVRGSRVGVYMGTYAPDNLFRDARPVEDAPHSPYLFGNFTAGAAGRVAFSMDLRGPVMVISTHCSSGLVALDVACGALTLGECDAALAGAVLLMLSPQTHYCEAPMLLSRRGACHAFDTRADGYVRGEGAGVLLLKRLADALRDGDRVLAVIRGSGVNNDGQSTRLTAPSTDLQQQLFRTTVDSAGIDPGEVGLVEAHGPGTAVGDPIEYTSIHAVYGRGRGRCALGSIKTNIGHSEPVSGIAGVVKAIECLRRGGIPPNQNFDRWNPAIVRNEESRLFVPTELTAWPVPEATRLAAVCSYGVTGTNAHVVLEQAPARRGGHEQPRQRAADPYLFLLSATSPESLRAAARRLTTWARTDEGDVPMADLAHTLAVRRAHADHRLGIVARNRKELATWAEAFAAGDQPQGVADGARTLPPDSPAGAVFVFTGQGSQRPGMCRGLLSAEPVFAAAIDELEPLVQQEAGFSLRQAIAGDQPLAGVDRVQPTLFAVQVALAALWRSWGVRPAAVIGQSLGEVAAAVVAGVLDPADGVRVICRRARLLSTISGGAMASVMLDARETRSALEARGADRVELAVLTSPGSTVISGDARQVRSLVEAWEADGTTARLIDVDVASHSSEVDPILDPLRTALADLPDAVPERGVFYSTVSDDPRVPGPLDAGYWVRNQRGTVRFHTAVAAALADGHQLFVECTAHPLAVRAVLDAARHADVDDVTAVGTLRQGVDDQEAFLTHLATVHTAGHDGIDWAARYGDGELVDAPGTAWHRTRHGGDQPPYTLVSSQLPAARQHPLLGGHVHDPDDTGRHLWQTTVGTRQLPWLGDHRVSGTPVLPGTGFAEIMLAASAEVLGTQRVAVTGIHIDTPMVLEQEPEVTTRLTLDRDVARIEVTSRASEDAGGDVIVHAGATARALRPDDSPPEAARDDTTGWIDHTPDDLYAYLRERHDVQHGPAFRAIDRLQASPDGTRAVSWMGIADAARVSASRLRLHPALADQVVQTGLCAWLRTCALSAGPVVLAGFDEIRLYGPTAHTRLVTVTLHEADELRCRLSASLREPDGTVVAELRGLHLVNITPPEQRYASRLAHLAWSREQAPAAAPSAEQRWLTIAPDGVVWARQLSRLLGGRSAPGTAASSQAADTHVLLVLACGVSPEACRDRVRHLAEVIRELAGRRPPPRLVVVWRADDPLATAGVPGLLRSAAFEHPELGLTSMEISAGTPLDMVVPDLRSDHPPMTEIAWRHGVRHVARLRPGPGPVSGGLPEPVAGDGGYLVTGGLGGLGLVTARGLAERGARQVVLCGRREPARETEDELAELHAATGTRFTVVLGDIAEPGTVERALAAAGADGAQLRGVVHAAGVVEDATISALDDDLLARVWRGKAEGAWTLHEAVLDRRLDFFVVYSSVASFTGSPGQGAYAAANAYLDALVTHRLAQGLPATGIHWGAWGRTGRGQHLGRQGFVLISPEDGTDALERILVEGHGRIAYSPIDVGRWIAPYPALRRSTLLAPLLADTAPADDGPSPVRDTLLAAADPAERRRVLERFVIDQVRDLLGGTARYIGPHTSLVVLGLDSLGGIQLQQRLQTALRTPLKPGVIWVKPSASALTEWLLDSMALDDAPRQERKC